MTPDLVTLLPITVLAATAVVVLLAIAIHRSHALTILLTLVGLVLAFAALPVASRAGPRQVTPLLVVDGYGLVYLGLLFVATFVVAVLSYGYLEKHVEHREEFYVLLLLAALGSAVLVASSHFAALFLGLEMLSVALYGLVAYLRASRRGIEAGLKYLILAAASAAFLLLGMALVYAALGTMAFDRIASSLAAGQGGSRALLLAGLALTVVGVGFKLAAVPFHMWTPDVYEGAPTPVTAFIATVSKGGVLALLIRLFIRVNPAARSLFAVLAIIAVASMLGGNLLALLQRNVKRILAYSSIGHLGYLLVAFLAGGALGVTAATFYLATYFLSSLGAFGVVGVLSGAEGDADNLDDYRGLFWRRPWLAGMLSITLFSLAGIPLTAGFVGKFLILTAGVGAAYWLLAIILVVSSVIGLFYYLRIIVAMILQSPAGPGGSKTLPPRLAGSLVLAALALALVGLGVYPGPLVQLIRAMVENL